MSNCRENKRSLRKIPVLDELEVSSREIIKGHLGEEYSNTGSNAANTSPEQGKDLFRAFF